MLCRNCGCMFAYSCCCLVLRLREWWNVWIYITTDFISDCSFVEVNDYKTGNLTFSIYMRMNLFTDPPTEITFSCACLIPITRCSWWIYSYVALLKHRFRLHQVSLSESGMILLIWSTSLVRQLHVFLPKSAYDICMLSFTCRRLYYCEQSSRYPLNRSLCGPPQPMWADWWWRDKPLFLFVHFLFLWCPDIAEAL